MTNNRHKTYMKVVNDLVKRKTNNENIDLVILGGSVARGEETEHSDIDINFIVKKKNLPLHARSFYKYKEKCIEEIYTSTEKFDIKDLPDGCIVIYDKSDVLTWKRIKTDEKIRKTRFLDEWSKAKYYQNAAKIAYKDRNFQKSTLHLLGTQSLVFQLIHILPQRYGLPFPSFRLLRSVKTASKFMRDPKIYHLIIDIYKVKGFETDKVMKTLRNFERIYQIMGKCYKNKYPATAGNLGFYDPLKIEYNIKGLRNTFKKYPYVYALRFIIGCAVNWALNSEDMWKVNKNKKYRKEVMELTKDIIKIKEFDENFVKEKLVLSKELEKRVDKSVSKNTKPVYNL